MKHRIMPNGNLEITVDASERRTLRKRRRTDSDAFGTDETMLELFGSWIANSEFQWCQPEDIGALTAAPILCTYDGRDHIADAWGFMDYQLRSPQDDLLDTGRCEFQHAK